MSLHDELLDLTARMNGLPSEAEALGEWAAVLGRLGRIADALGRRGPARRRSPRIEAAVNWLRRSLHDAPITEEVRAVAEGFIGRIKAIGGPVVVKEELMTREELHRPSRGAESGSDSGGRIGVRLGGRVGPESGAEGSDVQETLGHGAKALSCPLPARRGGSVPDLVLQRLRRSRRRG